MSKGKRIGIIGASASGIYAALLLKAKHPDYQITLFDRAEKIGKKILATGNGHCNLLHSPFAPEAYNNPDFVSRLLGPSGEKRLWDALASLGIETLKKGELVYPLSYSAASYVRYLSTLLEKADVVLKLQETVVGIQDTIIKTKDRDCSFDAVIFAFGGKSQPNLGSDGSMFDVLQKAGYHVTPLVPGLCPLRCSDVPKSLSGVRHAASIRLSSNGKTLYEEVGEVLFKKDGISGICIMNASLYYQPGSVLSLDFFPDMDEKQLTQKLAGSLQRNGDLFLLPFVDRPLMEYFLNIEKTSTKPASIYERAGHMSRLMKQLVLHPSARYGFEESQVTCGGVALSQLDENLRSKIHPNHYFVGECLDIHGLCGGHNLGFALLSAIVVSEALA